MPSCSYQVRKKIGSRSSLILIRAKELLLLAGPPHQSTFVPKSFTTEQSTFEAFFTCYLLYLLICLFHLFSEPQNITLHVEEGQELNITCHNRKITSSSVSWTRNGIPVQTGKSKFLYIKSVNKTHAGNYICVSLSPDGNHSSFVTSVDVLCEFTKMLWGLNSCRISC